MLADLAGEALEAAAADLRDAGLDAHAVPTDVRRREAVAALKAVAHGVGEVSVLMSNAGREGGGALLADPAVWADALDTNLWGAAHGAQIFAPDMIAASWPSAIVVTGSKQGITRPPGDAAYNVSKAVLRALAGSLAHELREQGGRVCAHLLIPGFTSTRFTRARGATEKPAAAWTPEQVVDFVMEAMAAGDLYILCPDNDVSRETDLQRIRWMAEDIAESRPALSRWHPDHAEAFARHMADGGGGAGGSGGA